MRSPLTAIKCKAFFLWESSAEKLQKKSEPTIHVSLRKATCIPFYLPRNRIRDCCINEDADVWKLQTEALVRAQDCDLNVHDVVILSRASNYLNLAGLAVLKKKLKYKKYSRSHSYTDTGKFFSKGTESLRAAIFTKHVFNRACKHITV